MREMMTGAIARRTLLGLIGGLMLCLGLSVQPVLARDLPDYKAEAGMMRIGTDPERPEAEIFHVAYTLKGANAATRPVTFVFNGGPGGATRRQAEQSGAVTPPPLFVQNTSSR